jgi:hypothetical protein
MHEVDFKKPFCGFDLSAFGPLTVFVGDNKVGKTKLLRRLASSVPGSQWYGKNTQLTGKMEFTAKGFELSDSTDLPHERDGLICVDGLGEYMYPPRMVSVIEQLWARPQKVIAIVYSPYALDHVPYNDIWVLSRKCLTAPKEDEADEREVPLNGPVFAARLTECNIYETWKEEMDPGELWSLVGCRWVGDLAKE